MSKQIEPDILRLHIRSTLQLAGWWSEEVEELMIGTSAQETHLGYWRRQMNKGPGRGIYSMELKTENDIWVNYLVYRPELIETVKWICGVSSADPKAIEENLAYQHLTCRLYYRRISEPLPKKDDIVGQAAYWDKHFNKNDEKGTVDEYLKNYRRFVLKMPIIGDNK